MRVSSQSKSLVAGTIIDVLEAAKAKHFLTEYDVQSWIFSALIERLEIGSDRCQLGLHCQTQFLKDNAHFGFIPDLAILNLDEYSIAADGNLYGKKGCTIWGDSILVEIKLFRGHRPFRKQEALKDILKLADVRRRHYQQGSYFPIFVLACRRDIGASVVEDLQRTANEQQIQMIVRTIAPPN